MQRIDLELMNPWNKHYSVRYDCFYGPQLWDRDVPRILGRIQDRGPYGTYVVNDSGVEVGRLESTVMCGSPITIFRPSPDAFEVSHPITPLRPGIVDFGR